MEPLSEQKIKTGIVAIVGPPNAGKSTLLNALLGQKISIVTAKPQTTRNRIVGIVNHADYQIVLLDTPGLHKASQPFNLEMVRIATESLAGVDLVLFLIDVSLPLSGKNAASVEYLKEAHSPAVLVLNKIDRCEKEQLLPIIDSCSRLYPFAAIIPIAALLNRGTDVLLKEILAHLPTGPRLYPEDIPTDSTERFIVAEMIREKIFLYTGQEIPYSTAVKVESFKEDEPQGLVTIHAVIYVEKGSQKGIVLGKKGSRLTKIGSRARRDIEELLGRRVFLKLWVKVQKDWTRDMRFIRDLEA
jgi:GTP-binding protein Era